MMTVATVKQVDDQRVSVDRSGASASAGQVIKGKCSEWAQGIPWQNEESMAGREPNLTAVERCPAMIVVVGNIFLSHRGFG